MRPHRLIAAARLSLRVQARIKLARLLELPDSALEAQVREIEEHPLFRRLAEAGILAVEPLPRARYAARTLEGRELRAGDDGGLSELLDGNGGIAKLIRRIGLRDFQEQFLGDQPFSDQERADACGISPAEALMLREFLDRVYVRSEFASAGDAAPAVVYSSVAGIAIEDGRPVVAFFNRELWKGRYRKDEARFMEWKAALPPGETAEAERLMRRIDRLAFRQTTLFRVLEALVEVQAAYLVSGDPERRRPLKQRELAERLGIAPSVLNCLISNKSVEAPWRVDIPLKTLLPSRKAMIRDRLYDLAIERPEAGDDVLREEIRRLYGAVLSRPSIIQYRKELGLGGCGRRTGQEVLR